jgi:hypothetical protein
MMKPDLQINAGLFVYNYLRNLYHLPYHEDLDNDTLVWGFTAVEDQACVVNASGFDLPDTGLNEVIAKINSRQTKAIRLISNGPFPQQNIWTLLNFTLTKKKPAFQFTDVKKTSKPFGESAWSRPVAHVAELVDIFKSTAIGDTVAAEELQNLTFLAGKRLITITALYEAKSHRLLGLLVVLPLKAFVISELILLPGSHISEAELSALVLSASNKRIAKTLVVITPQNWEQGTPLDKAEKVGQIGYYERQPPIKPMLPVPGIAKNAVLKTKPEYLNCIAILDSLGLPKHTDLPKNWDTLAALSLIVNDTSIEKDSPIMDAGGEYYSVIMHQLAAYGYTKLHCVNLTFTGETQVNNIIYAHGDITQTTFDNDTFAAITCLSVIEHIPHLEQYFAEMSRILKSGGILFISTDYWETAIDTLGKTSYDAPFKIFDKEGIVKLIDTAKKYGLELTEPVNLTCKNRIVDCEGFKYTFIYLTFIKTAQD